MPVMPDPFGEGAPRGLAPRHVDVVRASGVATHPGRVGVGAKPAGGCDRERVQGRAQRFDGAVEAVERPHGAEHVGGVRALPPTLVQQSMFLT